MKRIVLITGEDLQHRYVANRLAAEIALAAIVVDHGKPSSALAKVRRLLRRYTYGQLVSRLALFLLRKIWRYHSTSRRALVRVFGSENCSNFLHVDLVRHVHGVNTAESQRLIASLEPDVILVFGTGIVGLKVLSLARTIALNLHTGISPHYRGCDCAFWPLHNDELDMLGATVHECTMATDGGQIFGTTRIQLHADDDLFAVFARCVVAGTDLYARKVLELIDHGIEGTPQDLTIGKEYMAYMRGVRAEWKVRRSIQSGLIRRFSESQRVPLSICL